MPSKRRTGQKHEHENFSVIEIGHPGGLEKVVISKGSRAGMDGRTPAVAAAAGDDDDVVVTYV